jgi:hypothetical protein
VTRSVGQRAAELAGEARGIVMEQAPIAKRLNGFKDGAAFEDVEANVGRDGREVHRGEDLLRGGVCCVVLVGGEFLGDRDAVVRRNADVLDRWRVVEDERWHLLREAWCPGLSAQRGRIAALDVHNAELVSCGGDEPVAGFVVERVGGEVFVGSRFVDEGEAVCAPAGVAGVRQRVANLDEPAVLAGAGEVVERPKERVPLAAVWLDRRDVRRRVDLVGEQLSGAETRRAVGNVAQLVLERDEVAAGDGLDDVGDSEVDLASIRHHRSERVRARSRFPAVAARAAARDEPVGEWVDDRRLDEPLDGEWSEVEDRSVDVGRRAARAQEPICAAARTRRWRRWAGHSSRVAAVFEQLARTWIPAVGCARMQTCWIGPGILRRCYVPRGLRAGGPIVASGGLCAERTGTMSEHWPLPTEEDAGRVFLELTRGHDALERVALAVDTATDFGSGTDHGAPVVTLEHIAALALIRSDLDITIGELRGFADRLDIGFRALAAFHADQLPSREAA